jgi:DNA-binding beta-propeller fold protein YncE
MRLDKVSLGSKNAVFVPGVSRPTGTQATSFLKEKETRTMHSRRTGGVLVAAIAAVLLFASAARAVDAPKWVAAMYIQGQKAVGLRWNPVPGATGYKVLRSTTAGADYKELSTSAIPQLIDTATEAGITYYYVLQSVAGAEVSANSDERTVAIPGEKKVEAIKAPAWSKVTLTQSIEFGKPISKVGLIWITPAGNPVAYNLYRSTTPGKDYQMLTSTSETQYVDLAVEIGKTYYYTVTAIDQNFQETPMSAEQTMVIKEPEKKEEPKARKEKIGMLLRRTKLVKTIKSGSFGELAQPTGVAVNSKGEIFVSDGISNKVYAFDANGEFLFSFGEKGNEDGQMNFPIDIAIDGEDRVYVTMNGPKIEIYNSDGRPQKSINLKELFGDDAGHASGGIECGPDYWYFTDDPQNTLYAMEYDSNKIALKLASLGDELGQITAAKKPFFSKKQKALVLADMFNFRVQIFRDNKAELFFGSYGNSVTQFSRVIDVAEDDLGNILAADFGNQTIQGFGWDGTFKYVLGTEDGVNQMSIAGVTGIVVVGKRLILAEKVMGRVTIYDLLADIGPPVKAPKAAGEKAE